ncbi:hypothetical protein WICPIJ_007561 [Wickerhamomyces pijperi]|uniref:Uncharacterized protein n=1 Tax=Wickerhamomyces pijperi TaxID=599730 RepID=A0A9P8PZJ5_WICPI|nr:hypothetical protein WICPIJ_007561 [Wickerhamomyces pijperi]
MVPVVSAASDGAAVVCPPMPLSSLLHWQLGCLDLNVVGPIDAFHAAAAHSSESISTQRRAIFSKRLRSFISKSLMEGVGMEFSMNLAIIDNSGSDGVVGLLLLLPFFSSGEMTSME